MCIRDRLNTDLLNTDLLDTDLLTTDHWLRLAASAERGSEHPLGEAIVRAAEARGLALSSPEQFEAIAGHGISAVVDGQRVLVGNRRLMEREGVALNGLAERAEEMEAAARTTMWVAAVSYTHLDVYKRQAELGLQLLDVGRLLAR